MKLIKSIESISPIELVFDLNKLDEKLLPNTEVEIKISITVEELKQDDQGNFRAIVAFLLRVGDEDENLFKLSYQIDFTSLNENFNLKDKEYNFALFEIVEPFVRYRLNELLSQTKFASLEIPYRFWEIVGGDSEV
ncbi:hypothetical protein FXF62_10655 [Streptococcus cristatus]|uniref:Preprotein translocase subunit SecB n=1 Tax=Streptococcus cristatus TaxID=45634 RepID=A0A5B0DBD3_STRCR|nr:hypothetical protein [Streptococcus cristatus]KAA0963155.1 hypothetical protein FXF62_10655 [Streptococcus cristatus]